MIFFKNIFLSELGYLCFGTNCTYSAYLPLTYPLPTPYPSLKVRLSFAYPSLILRLSFAYPSLILRLSFAHPSSHTQLRQLADFPSLGRILNFELRGCKNS